MEQKITEILSALQGAVTDLAPDAWLALVVAARVDSILSLAFSMTVVTLATVWMKTVRKTFKWIEEQNDSEPIFAVWGIGTFVLAVLVVIAAITLFSTSTWLGLFYPEAAVVRELLSKAAG